LGPYSREVQKTFDDPSQRTSFARFSRDTLLPKIDIAESKDAIIAERGCRCDRQQSVVYAF